MGNLHVGYNCPDCGALMGSWHRDGCSVAAKRAKYEEENGYLRDGRQPVRVDQMVNGQDFYDKFIIELLTGGG